MSTQRPEDVSEAVVTPVAAAGDSSRNADALSLDDTNSLDATDATTNVGKIGSTEELDCATSSAESEVTEKVKQDAVNSPTTDFSQKLSENVSS